MTYEQLDKWLTILFWCSVGLGVAYLGAIGYLIYTVFR